MNLFEEEFTLLSVYMELMSIEMCGYCKLLLMLFFRCREDQHIIKEDTSEGSIWLKDPMYYKIKIKCGKST